jgi:hypothetical protein
VTRSCLCYPSILRVVVDPPLSVPHDDGPMRRFWLTVLVAFSLAVGGAANAWAARNCPDNAAPSMHDCCPDDQAQNKTPSDQPAKKQIDCKLGQACRASIAVTPTLPLLSVVVAVPGHVAPDLDRSVELPAFSLPVWRPPRTA